MDSAGFPFQSSSKKKASVTLELRDLGGSGRGRCRYSPPAVGRAENAEASASVFAKSALLFSSATIPVARTPNSLMDYLRRPTCGPLAYIPRAFQLLLHTREAAGADGKNNKDNLLNSDFWHGSREEAMGTRAADLRHCWV